MPKTSEMRSSKFLKQEDVPSPVLWTIEKLEKHNVAKEGAEIEYKWCLEFAECDKPLVLNSTNIQLCERIFGSDDTDHWMGKKLVLYVDPTVSYAGKITGGIRVRAPKKTAAPTPPPVQEVTDDDIPF